MNRIRVALVSLLILLSSVFFAPPAQALQVTSPCSLSVNSWAGSASVRCRYGSYRIGVWCTWWSGGSFDRGSAWSVPAPKYATAYCPLGSRIVNAGAFWSDGRLIGFWR